MLFMTTSSESDGSVVSKGEIMLENLQQRLLSGSIAFVLFLIPLSLGGVWFQVTAGLLAVGVVCELMRMYRLQPSSIEGILTMFATLSLALPLQGYMSFLQADASVMIYTLFIFILMGSTLLQPNRYSYTEVVFPIASSFYVGIGFHSLILAREASMDMALLALLIVWSTDIGAYFAGMRFGNRKLLPEISPNKTIEGGIGGIVASIIVVGIFMLFRQDVTKPYGVLLTLIFVAFLSACGQVGDLVESAIKRRFGVKDSGNIIPGHGGLFDRFDSTIFVLPVMHILGFF